MGLNHFVRIGRGWADCPSGDDSETSGSRPSDGILGSEIRVVDHKPLNIKCFTITAAPISDASGLKERFACVSHGLHKHLAHLFCLVDPILDVGLDQHEIRERRGKLSVVCEINGLGCPRKQAAQRAVCRIGTIGRRLGVARDVRPEVRFPFDQPSNEGIVSTNPVDFKLLATQEDGHIRSRLARHRKLVLHLKLHILRHPTRTAPASSSNAIARVLLHTTRTEVNCAVVASVPSQAVASSK